jgi:hypothetical protein
MDAKPLVTGGKEIVPDFTMISRQASSAKTCSIKWGRFSSFARM